MNKITAKPKKPTSKQTIIDFLLDGWGINILRGELYGNFAELVSGGYANYSNGLMTKNWKTEYYTETVPEPVENRFEILDL